MTADLAPARRSLASLAAVTGAVAAAMSSGRTARPDGWYRRLKKPSFQPKPVVFAIVWPALYAAVGWSAWRVARRSGAAGRGGALALWAAQLGLNAAWSPLFFGRHRALAALVDHAALTSLASLYAWRARKIDRAAAAVMLPYLAWLKFAGLLQVSLLSRNRRLWRA